jgi:hypothetical protein
MKRINYEAHHERYNQTEQDTKLQTVYGLIIKKNYDHMNALV